MDKRVNRPEVKADPRVRQSRKSLWRWLTASAGMLVGGLLVLIGLVLTPLPIPFGLVLVALGLILILSVSPAARAWLKHQRTKRMVLDDWLERAESFSPGPLRSVLRDTDPDGNANEPKDDDERRDR